MIILIIAILLVVIGIILLIIDAKVGFWFDYDIYGIISLFVGGLILFITILILLTKPISYKNFKVKYETIKEMVTSKNDIRDATFTNSLIEINEDIKSCNEYKNSVWIGIFQIKEICETEPLRKEDNNE